MSGETPPELAEYFLSLPHSLREYAYAYAEHLSLGELEPSQEGHDPELTAEIRRRLHAEWRRRRDILRDRNRTRRQ
jgi:hypothetical protein